MILFDKPASGNVTQADHCRDRFGHAVSYLLSAGLPLIFNCPQWSACGPYLLFVSQHQQRINEPISKHLKYDTNEKRQGPIGCRNGGDVVMADQSIWLFTNNVIVK